MTQLWSTTLEALDSDGIPVQQRAFLSLARLVGLLDGTALIAVPNDFTKDMVETRLRDRVTQTLSAQLDRDIRLAVTVDPSLSEPVEVPDEEHDLRVADRRRQIDDMDIGEDELDGTDAHGVGRRIDGAAVACGLIGNDEVFAADPVRLLVAIGEVTGVENFDRDSEIVAQARGTIGEFGLNFDPIGLKTD